MANFRGAVHSACTQGAMRESSRPNPAPTFEDVDVSILISADAIDHGLQRLRFSRLYEVILKSGFHRLTPIGLLSPTGKGDQMRMLSPRSFLNLPRRLIAIEQRHADIEQHELRGEFIASRKRLDSVMHRAHLVAFEAEQHFKRMRGIAIVVCNQDTQSSRRCRGCSSPTHHVEACYGLIAWQSHDEFAAKSLSGTRRRDCSAVQLDDAFDESQADA